MASKKRASLSEIAEYIRWVYGDTVKKETYEKHFGQKRNHHGWTEKIGTYTRASMELIRMIGEYQAAHPPHLLVRDASTREEFRRNADRVYSQAHPSTRGRGRTTDENNAMIRLLDLSRELGRDPKYREMVDRLMDGNSAIPKLSKNTANKYAKLYRLWKQQPKGLSKSDKEWLAQNFGTASLSAHWWEDRWWQWFEERARRAGILNHIAELFDKDLSHLRRERKQLESRQRRLLQQK
jgi:hypothetical protein